MTWQQLKEKVYFEDGSLRDIYINDFSRDEWQQWIDYVNSNHKITWVNPKTGNEQRSIDFQVIEEFWESDDLEQSPTATIHIKGIRINTFFFIPDQFDSDIDPKEINSIDDHNELVSYLKTLSELFGKEVIVTEELHDEFALMKVNGENITYHWQ